MYPAIRIDNLGKRYRVNHSTTAGRNGYRTLREELVQWAGAPWRWLRNGAARYQSEDFWALRGVGFEVQAGEVVGIVGRNGAGKSTLLKVLSRITKPTEGCLEMRGRVASLLEVGTGFHPELTGRENIYLNGAILGMSRREIAHRFDEIVAFAEVERFLDTPIKRFSSGMYTRLGFAVAAHLDSEILVVDEVLAVGDAGFQKKCLGKMQEIGGQGRTVLFVSHNMAAVQALCPRTVLLDLGKLVCSGPTEASIATFRSLCKETDAANGDRFPVQGQDVLLEDFHTETINGAPSDSFEFREPFHVRLRVNVQAYHRNIHALIILRRETDGCRVASITTREIPCGELARGPTSLVCTIDPNPLLPGDYYWSVLLLKASPKPLLELDHADTLVIREAIIPGASHPFTRHHGIAHICSRIEKS